MSTRSIGALGLALAHIRASWGGFVANAGLLALAVASLVFLAVALDAMQARAERDAQGIDLVVGAKGSGLQIVLSSLYHVDISPGNMPLAQAEQIARHPMVAKAVPVSLGDNFRGFRIVGNSGLRELYAVPVAQGADAARAMDAVLGAEVAARAALKVGDTFYGTHGLAEGGAEHRDARYTVTGILAPSGSVLDRLILTPLESVWIVHEGYVKDPEELKILQAEREVSALLLRYRTPIAAATLPRAINAGERTTAASPAFETARLLALLEPAVLLMQAFALLLILASLTSIALATHVSLRERRGDAAVLRMMGLSRLRLLRQYLLEAGLLGLAGTLLGGVVAAAVLWTTSAWLASGPKVLMPELTQLNSAWFWMALALPVALLAALPSALRATRIEPSRVLAER
jgi:putative ABC transport system permease protein